MSEAYAAVGASADDLAIAEELGILSHRPAGFIFAHPLLRAAALSQPDASLRRDAHRALAAALPADDFERRAHHLDLSCDGPNDAAADALEHVAGRAGQRGAHEVAAQAWERAARHSTSRADTARRLGEASATLWRANRPDLGISLGEEAWALADPGVLRAKITLTLADMIAFWRDSAAALDLMVDEARSVEAESPQMSATLMSTAANMAALRGDFKGAVELAASASTPRPQPTS
jgi:hypothetical protein